MHWGLVPWKDSKCDFVYFELMVFSTCLCVAGASSVFVAVFQTRLHPTFEILPRYVIK